METKAYQTAAEESMEAAVLFLEESLGKIRAGKANVKILDGIRIEYYGTTTPLSGVSTITTPDARTISIQPWEKKMIQEIERALINSDLGLTPANNGEVIRLMIPPLTEDRRKQLAKQCKNECEETKISIRNARRDAIEKVKKLVKEGLPEDVAKDFEATVQKIHDRYIKKVEELYGAKEQEIMTV